MGLIQYNNADIYYEIHGTGAPLLYLHGWNGSMSRFKKNVLPRILTDRQVILLDLPGCGRSCYTDISFKDMSCIIRNLLNKLCINSTSVAGFCLGGALLLDLALRYPPLVDDIFLLETTIGFPIFLKLLLIPGLGHRLLRFGLYSNVGSRLAFAYLLQRGFFYQDGFKASFATNNVYISRRYMRLVMEYSKVDHIRRVQERLKSPLIIVNGKKSPYYVKDTTRKLLKAARNVKLFELKGARHFVVEERPDLLASILIGHRP